MNDIQVSIVTINLNNKNGLERTLKSVENQNFSAIELIIVDGKSSDGSQELVHEFMKLTFLRRIQYVSESDNGIYDAMNKGLSMARGTYIVFLNSGDCMDSSMVVSRMFTRNGDFDLLYGNIKVNESGRLKVVKSNPLIQFYKQYQHDLPPIPAVFFRRSLLLSMGGFDISYKIIADVVLIARIFSNQNIKYKHIDITVSNFEPNGISSVVENQKLIFEERERFIADEYPSYLTSFNLYCKSNQSLFGKIKAKIRSMHMGICS